MKVEVKKDVYWVGAVDWSIRRFHGYTYSTHRGTTYNAYLITDRKTALVDTVYPPFEEELIKSISELTKPDSIDYMICNHVEVDHSGAIPKIMELNPKAALVCSSRGKDGLIKHYGGDWNYKVVKTGDEIKLGSKTLKFIEAPMLHWPDSMFTYIPEDKLLLPNDAFGQHIATSERFDDEVDNHILMDEAAKYYANILWPLSGLVARKLKDLGGLDVDTIAPSHGIIWRKNPNQIVEAYGRWANGAHKRKAVIAYDTMWGATEAMANAIADGLSSKGVSVIVRRIPVSDRGDIIKEMLDAAAVIIGSSTINNSILPTVASLLEDIKGLKPVNKVGFAFGAYGWSGGAVRDITNILREGGLKVPLESVQANWKPTEAELKRCFDVGVEIAKLVGEK
ncbi:MAG: flavodoxin domain-containing protein [Candidatus Altiarchaeota archaeon]